MYLKSITLKGFKSFPDRTRLEFGPGISVIVGPNGSGKSNVTDAVLWTLGEQSPLAVRGQTMQDMVFAGGQGVKGRSSAQVEILIDNTAGRLQSEFAEISISREVDRSGEGTYRLNGARCRLVDLLEVLSDSGLGKEMHSVISQGKVEAIVHSKPEDRTAMIEEAAGLTKHRKRRHRAQLKLRRTQDNLDRALDVEREARSRLRPLKRQAEAAELHARLERQSLEARSGLLADDLIVLRQELATAEQSSAGARSRRDGLEAELMKVARAREHTERSFADHGRAREELAGRVFTARSAADRLEIRLESARQALEVTRARLGRAESALSEPAEVEEDSPGGGRLAELEAELARLNRERATRLENELSDVEAERLRAERSAAELAERVEALSARLSEVGRAASGAAERGRTLGQQTQEHARSQAKLELELEAIEERLRLAGEAAREGGWRLADRIEVDAGFEAALAAALGGRLGARVVDSVAEAAAAVERAEDGGTRAVVSRGPVSEPLDPGSPPVHGAERLRDRVRPAADVGALVDRLLERAWVVERIADIPEAFTGIAVTRAGVAYDAAAREAWRVPEGGAERAIAERARREELHAALEQAAAERRGKQEEADRASLAQRDAEEQRDVLEGELRDLGRRRSEALETARRCAWVIEQRREHGVGPEDARRAELSGEITAERRLAERLERERAERAARRGRLEALVVRDQALVPAAERLIAAIEEARAAVTATRDSLERELSADEAVGERVAAKLRELATGEYELQAQLREAAEALTHEEVRVAQIRDRESGLGAELEELERRLGVPVETPADRLGEEERTELSSRLERLERRRERLGPVNPLAEREYEEAVAHVEELEGQRKDLEEALKELQGLIRETDRLIRESFTETFEAAAKNFADVIERLFPGGRGALRRVNAAHGPRPVLGGEEERETPSEEPAFGQRPAGESGGDVVPDVEEKMPPDHDTPGIEIEVTPAGKTTRRLSLLSGGEKSLVALAFMFAVFLARPCPFYILDEVEAALDDANIDRFLSLVRAYSDRAQFIIVTHQRRTMEAADVLYGVSMGKDGVSKVVSRRLAKPAESEEPARAAAA
jgi:chromosome segregation protein